MNTLRMLPLLVVLLILAAVPVMAAEKVVDSKISDVVVYPNHAQITREVTVDVKPGHNAFVFSGLVAVLDSKSVRATTEDKVKLTGTEIRHRYLDTALNSSLAGFDKRLKELARTLRSLNVDFDLVKEEMAFYRSIKKSTEGDIGDGLQGKTISVKEWKDVLAFVREGLKTNSAEFLRLQGEIQTVNEERAKLHAERKLVTARSSKEMKEIVVTLKAERAGRAKIRIHYLVPNATWRPVYDIHLSKDNRTVNIVGYGLITQGTGEEWDNVRMTLAMAEPTYSLSRPEMSTMFVSFSPAQLQQLAQDIQGLNRSANSENWRSQRFKSKQEEKVFNQNLNELANGMDQVELQQTYGISKKDIQCAFLRMGSRFSGVSYELSGFETILSDRSPHKVVIFNEKVPVDLHYVASPSADSMVVRRGDIVNSTGMPMIEGEGSIFVNGSYVGFAQLPGTAQNEPFSVYFGPDDSLKAERTLLRQDITGPEHFRQSKLATYHYRLTIENFKKQAVKVDIMDQIPIAQTQNIRVEMLNSSHKYTKDEKGILTWVTEIPAGETLQIDFSFQIEYPVNQTLYWK